MQNHESNSIYSQWAEASKDGLQELSYHLPLTTSQTPLAWIRTDFLPAFVLFQTQQALLLAGAS